LRKLSGKSYRRAETVWVPGLSSRHNCRFRETSLYQPLQSTHVQIHLSLITLFGTPLKTCHDEARRRSNASVVLVYHPQLPASISPLPLPLQRTTEFELINSLCSIVISVFAIVILSIIGSLFKSNHHSMMGSTDDPKDGPAVAATVFSAVIVYVVRFFQSNLNGLPVASIYSRLSASIRLILHCHCGRRANEASSIGLPCRLRFPSLPSLPR